INTYGSYLQKNGDCFKVKTDDKVFEVSAKKIESILISTAAYITTDAIKLAMENNIDIVFLDEYGNPYARIWHSKLGSTVLIRRRQLEKSSAIEGAELAKEWIKTKINNQIDFLKRLAKTREDLRNNIYNMCQAIEDCLLRIDNLSGQIEDIRNNIMSIEALAAKTYFECISLCLPERYRFDGRSRDPAKDYFNAMLNYSYGILYSMVEKACIIAGIDPYIGFLHSDNYNKKSMVFDLIELYRIFAEESVVFLFTQRQIKDEYFDKVPNGFTLNKEGKAVLLENFMKFLDEPIKYKNRVVKRRHIIQLDLHNIANSFIRDLKEEK
ncbi:MAG: CRISPR-associated endonuclease Cas1, partial [Myxococcota bacterium]